jgi:hypothetical protein
VFRQADGSIKVRGLATEAALVEADDLPSDQASRGDTVALVALTYALLTSRWPLPGPDSGLEAAPRVVGGVAAPSEIAVGVPPDLDFVARHTLREQGGPQTPGELVEQIGPWSPTPVGAGLEVQTVRRLPGNRTEPLDRDRTTGGVAGSASARARGGSANGRATSRGATTRGAAGRAAGLGALAGGAAGAAGAGGSGARGVGGSRSVLGMNLDTRGADIPAALGEGPDPDDELARSVPDGEPDVSSDELDGSPGEELGYGPYEEGDEGYDDGTARPSSGGTAAFAGTVAAGAAAGTAAVAKGFGNALGAAGSLASRATGRMGGMARGAADRAAERSATRAERRQTERWEDPLEQVRLSETLESTDEQLEPALPLLPGTAQEPLDKDQSRLVLVVIASSSSSPPSSGSGGCPSSGWVPAARPRRYRSSPRR